MKKKIKKYSTLIVPLLLIMILVSDKVAYACSEDDGWTSCSFSQDYGHKTLEDSISIGYVGPGNYGTSFNTVTEMTIKNGDSELKLTIGKSDIVKGVSNQVSNPLYWEGYQNAVLDQGNTGTVNESYKENQNVLMSSFYGPDGMITTKTTLGQQLYNFMEETSGCKTVPECTKVWTEINDNQTGGVITQAELVATDGKGGTVLLKDKSDCKGDPSCEKYLGYILDSTLKKAQVNEFGNKAFGTKGETLGSISHDPNMYCVTGGGGDPDNPDVPNNPSTPPSSGDSDDEYREKKPLPTIPKQSFHEDEPGNFECGKPYKEVRYEKGPSMAPTCDGEEGWPYFEIKTTYSVSAFSAPTSVTAGQSFGVSNVNASVKTEVIHAKGGSAMVKAALDKNNTEISNIKDVTIFNLNQDIKKLKNDINAAYKKWDDKYCSYSDDNTCTKCADDPKKTCCAYHGDCTRAKAELYNDYMTIKTKNDKEIEEKEKAIEEENEKLKKLEEKKEQLEVCRKEYNSNLNASKTGNLDVNNLTGGKNALDTSNSGLKQTTTLKIGDTTQSANSVIGFTKGSGGLSTTSGNNTIPSNGQFSIPVGIANKSEGQVSTTIELAGKQLKADCPISTVNVIRCTDCPPAISTRPGTKLENPNGLNLVYRPISLTNPFPKFGSSSSRDVISIWSAQTTRNTIINNNRGVADYQVYNLEPMYEITLTPKTIKDIRDYNKSRQYDDYTLTCTNGMECKSSFLRNFLGSAVKQSTCGLNSDWYACDSNEAKELKKHFLQVLN